jgi:hypothetical protein
VDALSHDGPRFGHALDFEATRQVQTTTLEQLIREHGSPFFLKIDVEGHELNALRGLRQPVPYLSFELNLPEFTEEGVECVKLLARLAPHGQFNYTVECHRGLALDEWLSADRFTPIVAAMPAGSIEVLWRTVQTV